MKINYITLISRTKKSLLITVSLVVALVIVAILFFESYSSYQRELRSAEIQSSNLTQVLAEQILSSFTKIDVELQEFQEEYAEEKSIDTKRADYFNKHFLLHKNRLPEVLGFRAMDAKGNFIADNLGIITKSNISEREYFQYLKRIQKDELVISKPIISKITHTWIVVLARPLLSKAGTFRGLVTGSISLDHYNQMFSAIDVGRRGIISLYGFDNILYARKPWSNILNGTTIKLTPRGDKFNQESKAFATYRNQSLVDGADRVITVRKIANYPYVIAVGLAEKDIMSAWKVRTGLYTIFILLNFFVFAYFLSNFLKALEQLEEQRKQAIQSEKLSALGEMASGIAHEINNPLTIISTMAMNLRRPKSTLESDLKLNESLNKIISTGGRIAKIISGLHAFSRDSFNDPMIPYSIKKIIDNTLELCHERLKSKNIDLKILPFEDLEVDCREVQIAQVIMNLLNNSVDAIERDDEKWIQIDVQDLGDKAVIIISDSGKKIPNAVAEKIMQPFFTTKEIGKGTGLGLSISKGIIENHRGKFYFDRKAQNTTFVIELPKTAATVPALPSHTPLIKRLLE